MIYDDYIQYTNEYRVKYGYETVVFLQVGDFFELYAVQNAEETAGADIFRIGELCNLQVTRKNKSLPENSRSNPYMAGFPLPIVQKHVQTLTQNNYTVVIVRQVTPPPNVQREVTEVVSPSTNIQTPNNDGNFLLSIYAYTMPDSNLAVGISGVDVTTGHTFTYEAYSHKNDPSFATDEVYRLVAAYAPKEIVVIGDECSTQHQEEICRLFQGTQSRCVHFRWQEPVKIYQNVSYQNEVLKKAFPATKTNAGLLSCIEACHLERMDNARTSFVYMIQFAYEHCEKLVEGLQIPDSLQPAYKLTLEYNSALQLNLISQDAGERSLLTILNRCGTAFGRRLFKQRLLQPISDVEELGRRYDLIAQFETQHRTNHVHKMLTQIQDLERFVRRMIMGTFSPIDWYCMHTSLCNAHRISQELKSDCAWQSIIQSYESVLDMEECSKFLLHDIKSNVFQTGVYQHLDDLKMVHNNAYDKINDIAKKITSYDTSGGDTCLCRVECNDRDGYYLVTTKKRWETAKLKGAAVKGYDVKPISTSSATVRITSSEIQYYSDKLLEAQRKLCCLVTSEFKSYVSSWITRHETAIVRCVQWLAEIDVACTCAKNAFEFGYTMPRIMDGDTSSIQCMEMRHPIIERLSPQLDYITNDICMGAQFDYNSILLYGINASGKSSFMKAIGLNVIMAQAGMYVACKSMDLIPYRHLFTRISGSDNIYRGMSSFTVEMSELNNILRRCDQHSLVLGDELCAGTESISGLAIVSAGIEYLTNRKTSFVFATHLHELTDVPTVSSIKNIRVAHMHIDLDPITGKITYGRKLEEGQGSRVYGLEVCSALGLPEAFLKSANQVRRYLQDIPTNVVRPSVSRYNAHTIVDKCKVCDQPATETHHLRYQCNAANGSVALGVGVHRPSNLVPLCEECHFMEHQGTLQIYGYVQTSHGIELQYKHVTNTPQAKQSQHPSKEFDTVRYSVSGWKVKTKNGVWKRSTEDAVRKKITKLLGCDTIDLNEWKDSLYDPSL